MSHTGNPRHPNNPPSDYPAEPTGAVAKDSLAGESIASGGAFGDNENPAVLGVKGSQSTLNNTDTSGATILRPARDGAAREARDAQGVGSDERGEVGVKYPDADAGKGYDGTFSDQGYRGGSGASNVQPRSTGVYETEYGRSSSGGTGSRAEVEVDGAPTYADDSRTQGDLKPKGENLVEGGDIPPNRVTRTGDVGGANDPGRLAERGFQKMNADASGGTGTREYGDVDRSGDGSNVYDTLDSNERA